MTEKEVNATLAKSGRWCGLDGCGRGGRPARRRQRQRQRRR